MSSESEPHPVTDRTRYMKTQLSHPSRCLFWKTRFTGVPSVPYWRLVLIACNINLLDDLSCISLLPFPFLHFPTSFLVFLQFISQNKSSALELACLRDRFWDKNRKTLSTTISYPTGDFPSPCGCLIGTSDVTRP